jgi:hypothetical protein
VLHVSCSCGVCDERSLTRRVTSVSRLANDGRGSTCVHPYSSKVQMLNCTCLRMLRCLEWRHT